MTCRECNEFILAYLEGELPADVHAGFERHLGRCPSCECYLRQYKATIAAGRIACSDNDAAADVPEDLIRAILESRRHEP